MSLYLKFWVKKSLLIESNSPHWLRIFSNIKTCIHLGVNLMSRSGLNSKSKNSEVDYAKTKQESCCKLRVSMHYIIWNQLMTHIWLFRQIQQEQSLSLETFIPTILHFPEKSCQPVTLRYFIMDGRSNTCSPLLCQRLVIQQHRWWYVCSSVPSPRISLKGWLMIILREVKNGCNKWLSSKFCSYLHFSKSRADSSPEDLRQ